MTDVDDKRAIRRSKRLEQAAAAEPPPPKRERSVPAAKVERSPSPPRGERGSDDDVTAAPPPARHAEAPVPPPKREASARRTAYVLRNRHVPDTSNREPCIPARYEKPREKLKHDDRPRSSGKKLKQEEPWEAISCARAGLEHYNSMNQGDEHELVKAVGVHSFIWCGGWLHANFLAKRKGAITCVDHVPKYFFAELKLNASGLSCASCIKLDSAESMNHSDCGVCPRKIMHPSVGGYVGFQPRHIRPAETGLQIFFSF